MQRSDGSPYTEPYFRTLVVDRTHTGGSSSGGQDRLIIPDDGIVRYTVRPAPGDRKIELRVRRPSAHPV